MPTPHVFAAARAARAPNEAGRLSARVFTHASLEVRWYAPHGVDQQTPHTRDEVYVVVTGKGHFSCNGTSSPCRAGDLLFAPAGAEHRFEDFSEDFATWVIFYGPEGGEAG
jgi:mannose-6-phosphate isomerase-like protein (cupin superfamily)